MQENTLIILRGLSGSGKSSRARTLEKEQGAETVSTDDFWVDSSGQYVFDYSRIGEAHEDCRKRADKLMSVGCPLVVVDNTNIRWWEMMPYIEMAQANQYKVVVEHIGSLDLDVIHDYFQRNTHHTPFEVIRRQRRNFEVWSDIKSGYAIEKARQCLADALKNGTTTPLQAASDLIKEALEWKA
jgi:predicted kinase